MLKSWVIDCFEEALDPDKYPRGRSFDDYKWVFDLEIKQLADEYELGIGKKVHMLEMIWENYKNIQGKAKEWWYDYWLEEDEKLENGDKNYDPPKVHLETFEGRIEHASTNDPDKNDPREGAHNKTKNGPES
ncbi:hypothetical protein Tco_1174560 [Tanacetum coccineum]